MPRHTTRQPRIRDLGRVFGIIYRANEKAIETASYIDEDLRAFHAPSECYGDAYRDVERVVEQAVAEAEALTGLTWRQIYDEIQQRTGGRWFNWLVYNSMIPLPDKN